MEIGPKDVRGWQIASPINARTLRKKKKKKKKKKNVNARFEKRVLIKWSAGAIIFFAL